MTQVYSQKSKKYRPLGKLVLYSNLYNYATYDNKKTYITTLIGFSNITEDIIRSHVYFFNSSSCRATAHYDISVANLNGYKTTVKNGKVHTKLLNSITRQQLNYSRHRIIEKDLDYVNLIY